MRSYEYNMNKIKEMESYDDSLKHKYLQATLNVRKKRFPFIILQ